MVYLNHEYKFSQFKRKIKRPLDIELDSNKN